MSDLHPFTTFRREFSGKGRIIADISFDSRFILPIIPPPASP